jgi:hypothetical protein
MSYDIPRLRSALPYCEKIDIESHDDKVNGVQRVLVTCHYTGGMRAEVECPVMPPTTEDMVDLVAAAAAQCLSKHTTGATFNLSRPNGTGRSSRTIKRVGGNGRPWSDGPRLYGGPGAAPSPREVCMTMQDAIDVDGVETSTSLHQRFTPPPKQRKPLALPAPAPPPERLDADKAKRASQAMAALLQATEDDDGPAR